MADSSHRPRPFTVRALIGRGLLHYRRTHAGVIMGVMVATGILTGALMVGDAVRGSLMKRVDLRLGQTTVAVSSGEHFVSAELVERLGADLGADTAGLVAVRAVATRLDGGGRANRVYVYGVDEAFGMIAALPESAPYLGAGGVALNAELAAHLGAEVGDTVIVRVDLPGRMHRDLALAESPDPNAMLRLSVRAVLDDASGGLFSLRAEQAVPMNAFVDRALLVEQLGLDDGINLVLVGGEASAPVVKEALRRSWREDDAGLALEMLAHGEWELRSRRVFIDDRILTAALAALPEARPILSYLINGIRSRDHVTPYSFVAAPGAPLVPAGMPDDEIMINRWLADDLGVAVGQRVDLRYFVMGAGRALTETNRSFRVHGIVPLEGRALDRALVPAFPGLSDVDNCRDWESGLPIDLARVRDKDEAYWDAYGGTPKAFVTLSAAQAMWRNRYGAATAIRGPAGDGNGEAKLERIMAELTPGDCGIRTIPVREMGVRAGSEGVDFGQLFLGLSIFIIVASLLLTGMLFAFSVEQRAAETGLLTAVGWPQRLVRRVRYIEGFCLAVPGALLGVGLGVAYNAVVLQGLRSVWQGAVGAGTLAMRVRVPTLVSGGAIGAIAAWAAMWLTVHRQLRRPPVEAQQVRDAAAGGRRGKITGYVLGILCWGGVAALVSCVRPGGGTQVTGTFLGAGALALLGCLAVVYGLLAQLAGGERRAAVGLVTGGIRAAALRPWHSLGTVAVLAAGTFLVIATGANRSGDVMDRSAGGGTGGFSFFAESALPVLDRPETLLKDAAVRFVPLRTFEGDDASCLNLNRVAVPPIWGVNPTALTARGAFSFAAWAEGVDADRSWDILKRALPDGAIPAVADQAVILWGLGKALGDEITVMDGRENPRRLRLVAGLKNSVFQGKVLVSEANFMALFPDQPGYRAFLVENNAADSDAVRTRLSRAFRDYGLDIRSAAAHLASFSVVQNTYLAIFLLLGAFGLLLGTAGMGVLVTRHILARRGELAMLRAVGFSRGAIRVHLLSEHGLILGLGLFSGVVAGLVAVWPALRSQGTDMSPWFLLALLIGLLVNGLIWMTLAVLLAIRGDLIAALREE